MAAVSFRCHRVGPEQLGKCVSNTIFTQFLHLFHGRGIWVERKANHLRKSIIRIVPFVTVILFEMLVIPQLLRVDNIRKLNKGNNVLLFEFITHQNSVWRTGEMYANLCIQCFYDFVHLIERFKAINILQLFLNL